MSEENKNIDTAVENTEVKETTEVKSDDSTIETLVADRVKSELAKIKSSLDNAYAERDQYKSQINELNKAKQKAEIEALEKAGKHSEVLKIEMNEIKQELEMYKKRNTELSRDNVVKSQLNALEFRNEKAMQLAHSDIINSLKQDTQGNWVHESGASVEEAINDYAKSEANAFMFKVKENVGSGVQTAKPVTKAPAVDVNKPASEMSQDELLQALETGAIKAPGTWNS